MSDSTQGSNPTKNNQREFNFSRIARQLVDNYNLPESDDKKDSIAKSLKAWCDYNSAGVGFPPQFPLDLEAKKMIYAKVFPKSYYKKVIKTCEELIEEGERLGFEKSQAKNFILFFYCYMTELQLEILDDVVSFYLNYQKNQKDYPAQLEISDTFFSALTKFLREEYIQRDMDLVFAIGDKPLLHDLYTKLKLYEDQDSCKSFLWLNMDSLEALSNMTAIAYDDFKKETKTLSYELFLENYDPQTRQDLAIWQTPSYITNFIVKTIDKICTDKFGKGVGDDGVSIYDFCNGTGSFVDEAIDIIIARYKRLESADDLKRRICKSVFGSELGEVSYLTNIFKVIRKLQQNGVEVLAEDKDLFNFANCDTLAMSDLKDLEEMKRKFHRQDNPMQDKWDQMEANKAEFEEKERRRKERAEQQKKKEAEEKNTLF